jgi:hypothetical protein
MAAGSTWDHVAIVPSSVRPTRSTGRVAEARHAFDPIVEMVFPENRLLHLQPVQSRVRPGHLAPDPYAFRSVGEVEGHKVLVIDDTWVTGARMRSVASALQRSGAVVVAMVAVARMVDTGAAHGNARWWSWVESKARGGNVVTEARCCLVGCTGQ